MFAKLQMMMQIKVKNYTRVSPTSNAQHNCCGAVTWATDTVSGADMARETRSEEEEERQERDKKWNVVVTTLNVGTMTGRGREVLDVMERKKIDVLCKQETRWKGQKAQEMDTNSTMWKK